jgi:NADH:ubiquinone oxidoreductase subunit
VPPEWHGWLHYTYDQPPAETNPLRRAWQRPPQANLTGTDAAYRPPGSLLRGGERAPSASADYEPWTPS